MAVRLAHFSDIHLTRRPLGWERADLLSKKVTGWANVKLLGRGKRFKHAPQVVDALRKDLASRAYDHLVFSGDATTLGFESEFAEAATRLGVGDKAMPPGIAVPGNHDYYTRAAGKQGLFEKHFGRWQAGERVDHHTYPFAQKVGHVWLIGVNSSTANWWTFDASGQIGAAQLERLRALCLRLSDGPRILVTHYPLRNARGNVEVRSHRLKDYAAALEVARECGISLWLHGHIHAPFVLETSAQIPFPIICAGSATQTSRWAYNEYVIDGSTMTMVRRRYNAADRGFVEAETCQLQLYETASRLRPRVESAGETQTDFAR